MIKALTSSKMAYAVLNRTVSYRFCMFGWAPLDPRKHITMNHNHHNMYLDIYEYGQYPDWVHIHSVPARTYEHLVVDHLVTALNQKLGSNLTAETLNSKRNRSWDKFLRKDLNTEQEFHQLYPYILGKLSQNIFVKESRYTWIVEQRVRFEYTLSSYDTEAPTTVGEFIDKYNEDIEACVLASNFGFAAEIDQEPSALEKHEAQQHLLSAPGVAELRNLNKGHNNFFNRLLAYIH